jgi:hypothetical protein
VKGCAEAVLIALSIFFLSTFFTFGVFYLYQIYTIRLSTNHVNAYVFFPIAGIEKASCLLRQSDIFILFSVNGTKGILRDNLKKFRDVTFGIGTIQKFSGRDKRDSRRLKNFRDGTNEIGTRKKFVPQVSRQNNVSIILLSEIKRQKEKKVNKQQLFHHYSTVLMLNNKIINYLFIINAKISLNC